MGKKEEIFTVVISEIDLYVINKVRQLRTDRNLSQLKLSLLLELAEGTVGKVENPKQRSKYNIRHLNLIAKALKCSPRDLLPEKPLKNDMVIVTFRVNKSKKEDSYFEVVHMEALK